MPDWNSYFTGYAAGTSTSDGWINISGPSSAQLQQEFEDYQRECEHQDRVYELQLLQEQAELEEERQLIKDKEKYPLFFWRELCSESVNEHMKQRKENI